MTDNDNQSIIIEATDRHKALDIPYPDPKTCCPECEGMGCSPFYIKAEDEHPSGEGWHYLKCIECKGAGKRASD